MASSLPDVVWTRMTDRALRADAARNVAQIRAAAIDAFHGRGLDTALEEIADAAGVSKGTIYSRFGGRAGLIDAVIGELVAAQVYEIIDAALGRPSSWEQVADYVRARRDLQYREPAFTDALLGRHPESPQLVELARRVTSASHRIIDAARRAGFVRDDFRAGDLYFADLANGLALRAGPLPTRRDYDRRTNHFLAGLRREDDVTSGRTGTPVEPPRRSPVRAASRPGPAR